MLHRFRRFAVSPCYLLLCVLIAMLGLLGDFGTLLPVMIVLVQVVALVLFLCDDLFPAFVPAFCVIILGATNLASLPDFLPYIPVAFTVVAGFVFHLLRYRRRLYIGRSFWGLVFTSVAVLLSGIGTPLATRDYTSPTAIYHIIGLSAGLLLLYLLFAYNRGVTRDYDPMHYFLWGMFAIGLLSCAVIFREFFAWFLSNLDEILQVNGKITQKYLFAFTYRNTIATLLVMCFPSAFYLARTAKRFATQLLFFTTGGLFYIGLILSAARTAWLTGSILLLILIVYYLYRNRLRTEKWIITAIFLGLGCSVIYLLRDPIQSIIAGRMTNGFIDPNETRVAMITRSFEDFLAHPVFGIGISSTTNADLYHAPICIFWYHMYFPQLWGSMGLLGVGTFLYQLFIRAQLICKHITATTVALGLTYLGLFLYSQTDVGEFAPIPYAVITVLIFVLLEDRIERTTK